MALRTRSWFDREKLFAAERIVRSSRAWMQVPYAGHWEGELILTTDRLFFLPHVDHAVLGNAAFWLTDITAVIQDGRNRVEVWTQAGRRVFELRGEHGGVTDLVARRATAWCDDVTSLRVEARSPERLGVHSQRRAAG